MVVKSVRVSDSEILSPVAMASQCWRWCKHSWTFGQHTYEKGKTSWSGYKKWTESLAEWIWILFLSLISSEKQEEEYERDVVHEEDRENRNILLEVYTEKNQEFESAATDIQETTFHESTRIPEEYIDIPEDITEEVYPKGDETRILEELPKNDKVHNREEEVVLPSIIIVEETEEDEFDIEEKEMEWRTANGGSLTRFAGLQNLAAMRSASFGDEEDKRMRLESVDARNEPFDPSDVKCEDVLWQSLVAKYATESAAESTVDSTEDQMEVIEGIQIIELTEIDRNESVPEDVPPPPPPQETVDDSPRMSNEEFSAAFSAALGKRLKDYLAKEASSSNKGEMSEDEPNSQDQYTVDEVKDISDEVVSISQHSDLPSESSKVVFEIIDEVPELIMPRYDLVLDENSADEENILEDVKAPGYTSELQDENSDLKNYLDEEYSEHIQENDFSIEEEEEVAVIADFTFKLRPKSKDIIKFGVKEEMTDSQSISNHNRLSEEIVTFKDPTNLSAKEMKTEVIETDFPFTENQIIHDESADIELMEDEGTPVDYSLGNDVMEPVLIKDKFSIDQYIAENDELVLNQLSQDKTVEKTVESIEINEDRLEEKIITLPHVDIAETFVCDMPDFEDAYSDNFELTIPDKVEIKAKEHTIERVLSIDNTESVLIMAESGECEEPSYEYAEPEEFFLQHEESTCVKSKEPALTTVSSLDHRDFFFAMAENVEINDPSFIIAEPDEFILHHEESKCVKSEEPALTTVCSLDHRDFFFAMAENIEINDPSFIKPESEEYSLPSHESIDCISNEPPMDTAISFDHRDLLLIMASSSDYEEPPFENVETEAFSLLSIEMIDSESNEPSLKTALSADYRNLVLVMAEKCLTDDPTYSILPEGDYFLPDLEKAKMKKFDELPLESAFKTDLLTSVLTMANYHETDDPLYEEAAITHFDLPSLSSVNPISENILHEAECKDNLIRSILKMAMKSFSAGPDFEKVKTFDTTKPVLDNAKREPYKPNYFEIVHCEEMPEVQIAEAKLITEKYIEDDLAMETSEISTTIIPDIEKMSHDILPELGIGKNLFSDRVVDETYNTILDREAALEADERRSSGSFKKGILDTTVYELDSNFDSRDIFDKDIDMNDVGMRVDDIDMDDIGDTTSIDEMLAAHLSDTDQRIPEHLSDIHDLLSSKSTRSRTKKSWQDANFSLSEEELPTGTSDKDDLEHFRSISPGLTAEEEAELAELAEIDKHKAEAEYKEYLTMPVGLTKQELDELDALKIDKENSQLIRDAERKELEKFLDMPTGLSEQEQLELSELLEDENQDEDISRATEERLAAFLAAARMEGGYAEDDLEDIQHLDDYMNLPVELTEEEEMILREGTDGELDMIKDEEYRAKVRRRYLDELEEDEDRALLDEYEFAEQYGSDFEYDEDYEYEEGDEEYYTEKDDQRGVEPSSSSKKRSEMKGTGEPVPPPRKQKKDSPELVEAQDTSSKPANVTPDSSAGTSKSAKLAEETKKSSDVQSKKLFSLRAPWKKNKK